VEEIKGTGGDGDGAPEAEVSTRQIFKSVKLRTYISRADPPGCGRETAGIPPSSPT
jgi:hypothetical protein